MRQTTLSPTRGRTRWRRGEDCSFGPTTGGRKRSLLRTTISPGRCSLLELQAGIARWELYVSHNGKKFEDKLDGEIKLAGLWALVLAELEKHLILNSHRLRTLEDARLEIVTDVEAKFGFRDSKQSDTVSRGHSVPTGVDAFNLYPAGHRVHEMVVSSSVEHIFNETAMHEKATAGNNLAEANRASHGPRVKAKTRVKNTGKIQRTNPKEPKTVNQGAKGLHNGKTSKIGLSGLENSKSEASSEIQESAQWYHTDNSCTDTSWFNDGWSHGAWNDDRTSVGWHEGWATLVTIPQTHLWGETQEERLQYFDLRRSDVDDDGASCCATSTRNYSH